jgi:hypothetical protein
MSADTAAGADLERPRAVSAGRRPDDSRRISDVLAGGVDVDDAEPPGSRSRPAAPGDDGDRMRARTWVVATYHDPSGYGILNYRPEPSR